QVVLAGVMLAVDLDADALATDRNVAFGQFLARLGDFLFDGPCDHSPGLAGGGNRLGRRFLPAAGARQREGDEDRGKQSGADRVHVVSGHSAANSLRTSRSQLSTSACSRFA